MAKAKPSQSEQLRWDVYIIELISRIGVAGTVVITLLTLFIVRGTVAQHREFIDKFFLLKWGNDGNFYFYFIIVALIILFFVQTSHYKYRIKVKNERIEELLNERDMLRHKLLKK
jgi:nitrate/nitrite transporter NarK